ncbi:MAG: efflux RND transporter periplasmic adaptor subunit [Planctomycetia bacterium]
MMPFTASPIVLRGFAAATLFLGCLAIGCAAAKPPLATPPPPEVTTARPIVREIFYFDEYTGRIEATASVEVRPRVSGYLNKVAFIDGDYVKNGQVLFEIDDRQYKAEYDSAVAKVNSAQAKLDFDEIELQRNTKLRKTQSVSQEDLDQSRTTRDQSAAALMLARAQADEQKLFLEWCKVTSPLDGRIGKRNVDPGNLVAGTAGNATLLTTVVAVDPVYVTFDVDERSLQRYRANALAGKNKVTDVSQIKQFNIPAYVGLAGDVGHPFEGVIDFVDNQVNPGTGTVKARAVLPNPDRRLTPGFFARVRVRGSDATKAVLVSERAVGTLQDTRHVMTVGPDNKAALRDVTLGRLVDGLRVVERGLTGDETLIVNGLQRVRPGMTVKPTAGDMPDPLADAESKAAAAKAEEKPADPKADPKPETPRKSS